MVKFILRAAVITFIVCCTSFISKAQIGYDYAQYDVGVAVGFNQFYGDVITSKSSNALYFNFDYNQTPFLNYIFEFSAGKLQGGDAINDRYGRQFSANYTSYAFRIQLQGGEILDYSDSKVANVFKNLYAGAGLGILYSNISSINRYSNVLPGFYTPGVDKGNPLFLPVRIGYEFKIFNRYQAPSVKIDLGYQYDFVFSDDLDGFRAGDKNDAFAQFVIGVKFALGSVTSYRKQITY